MSSAQTRPKLVFVHEGKASYPEVAAYREFFADRYDTEEALPGDLPAESPGDHVLYWFIMGYYPTAPKNARVIHDYRSLSVGRGAGLKDVVKKWRNHKPALRIFQNRFMEKTMGFSDEVPSLLLGMAAPRYILDYRQETEAESYEYDFCYVGEVNGERRLDKVIPEFLAAYGDRRKLLLVGRYDEALKQTHAAHPNVIFQGRVPQTEVFRLLNASEVALCQMPDHRPHRFQTPTKLLEYAALGKKVVCNDGPSNRAALEDYGIKAWMKPTRLFPTDEEWSQIPDNRDTPVDPFLWDTVIGKSGVERHLP